MEAAESKIRIPPSLLGVASPIIWSNFGRSLGIWNSDWMTVAFGLLYLAIGFFMWRGSFKNSAGPLVLVYLGIPVGVFLDVRIHRFLWHYDRSPWPFEAVVIWGLALAPLLGGAVLARIIGSVKSHKLKVQ